MTYDMAAAAGDSSKATLRDVHRRSDSPHSVVLRRQSPAAINQRHDTAMYAHQRRRRLVRTITLHAFFVCKVTVDLYSASSRTRLRCATTSCNSALISASKPVQPGTSTKLRDHGYGLVYNAMCLCLPIALLIAVNLANGLYSCIRRWTFVLALSVI